MIFGFQLVLTTKNTKITKHQKQLNFPEFKNLHDSCKFLARILILAIFSMN